MSRSTPIIRCAGALLLALAVAPWIPAQAQNFDFSGQWEMATDVVLPGEGKPCSFVGYAQVVHNLEQGFLSGTAVLELAAGPRACPAELTGEISGNPDGLTIFNGELFGGILGKAKFTGGVVGAPARRKGIALGGGFDVIEGSFEGLSGGWAGTVSDGLFRDSFETLVITAGGSLVMLLGVGVLIGRRRA